MKALPVAALVLLTSCAAVPDGDGFARLQTATSGALGSEASWHRDAATERSARGTVRRLLEEPLTDAAAVRIALLRNPRLQAEYETLGIAEAELARAGLLDNPTLSAEIVADGGVEATVSLVQNVFAIVTRPARRTIAGSAFDHATAEAGHKVLSLAAEVRAAYYRLVADEQAAELFRQVTGATEAAADLAERQVQAGNASRRDQALSQAQYAKAVLELARLEAAITVDRERLNRLMGLWGDDVAWNLPGRLPPLPAEAPALDGLERLAVERRLDLAAARADAAGAGYALELGRQLRWLSMLGLGIQFERDSDGTWRKGPVVELTLPLFDQGAARIASLEGQQRRSEKLLVALGVEARSEVREAWVRLVAAHQAARFHEQHLLPLQQRIVEENQRLYNGMLLGVYDLLRSRQEQIEAARTYIGALKDYWVARAELEKAIAGPLPNEGSGS